VEKSLYDAYGTVKEYEQNGVVLDFGVAKFRVRRAGGSNRKFLATLAAKLRPHRRAIESNVLSDELAASLQMEVYFETVVIGWENVTDREGKALPFTLDNFKQVMTDLPDLWSTLREEADNMRNFQESLAVVDGAKLGES
jgi:hypothetical protein